MVLGLLGGAMVPTEIFPEAMRSLSWLTPQAWAMDAFTELRGAATGLADVLPHLGVLVLFAATLLGLAAWRFRRLIQRGEGITVG
jgi:ABC-2 type transport system permease protein